MSTKPKQIAKYKMIENDIMNKINSGDYVKGQFIQTEHELAQQYNVSRVTVRKATSNLVAKGYLISKQGIGTYVDHPTVVDKTTRVQSFTEEMGVLGKKVTSKILTFEIIPATEAIAAKLNIDVDTPIYYIKRLRKADKEPMMLETSYMDVTDYPNLSYEIMTKSKYKFVEESQDVTIDYAHHIIIPMMPTEEMIQHFNCNPDLPLLKVMNTTYLSSGNILDYTELIINTEKYQYQAIRVK